jgi:tetratricopeptide (TPR) repeat protein
MGATISESVRGSAPIELAARLMEGQDASIAALSAQERCAVAWALKDACYAAWTTEPQRAVCAARTLRTLSAAANDGASVNEYPEMIAALADWTEGIAHVARGCMGEAERSFDSAGERFERIGALHHAAEAQVPRIMALSMLGQHDRAIACANEARRAFDVHGDVLAAGKVSLNLGSLHLRRDSYREALRHYQDAAVLLARAGAREHSVMADIGSADSLAAIGDFDEALRMYSRARMRANTHGYPVLEALIEESTALVELARGRYREALSGLERSRGYYEALAMPQHLAIAEKQLADAYLELRLVPEALALFDRAGSCFASLEMPDDEAWTHAQRARALTLIDKPAEAEASIERAATLFAAQGNRVGLGITALINAEIALMFGNPQSALVHAERSVNDLAAVGLEAGVLKAEVVRARVLLACGHAESAQVAFASTRSRAIGLHLWRAEIESLTGHGLAARALGQTAVAEDDFSAAVALFEEQRRTLPGDDLRTALLSEHLRPYQELLSLALAAYARDESAASAGEVLRRLDRFRAMSLGDGARQVFDEAGDPVAIALRTRVNWLHRRSLRFEQQGEISQRVLDELNNSESELLEHSRRRRMARVHSGDDDAAVECLDIGALQEALEVRDALVEYGLADGKLFACVVSHAGVEVIRTLPRWDTVQQAICATRFQIDALRHGSAMPARHLPVLMHRARTNLVALHDLVWAPLQTARAGRDRLLVIPHAALDAVPFAALHDGEHYLAERLELAVAPSAGVALRRMSDAGPRTMRILAVGESSRLAHAADEARNVAAQFADGDVLIDEAATVDAVRARAQQANVIHLACHGQFRADNPRFSALHLHDGPLAVEMVESLQLDNPVVVLSACETAAAHPAAGDEMIGLVRAFLKAGAHRVVASLWPIDDAVTARFMSHFYSVLRSGSSTVAALRAAQVHTLIHDPHPFHWAAFTLHGGW